MDVCYYNNQIKEELDGANEYIRKAIVNKKDHAAWANMYLKMGLAELDHASMLVKIFEDDYKLLTSEMKEIPSYVSDIRTSILDMYTEFASKIEYMHKIYDAT